MVIFDLFLNIGTGWEESFLKIFLLAWHCINFLVTQYAFFVPERPLGLQVAVERVFDVTLGVIEVT